MKGLYPKLLLLVAGLFFVLGVAILAFVYVSESRQMEREGLARAETLNRMAFEALYTSMRQGGGWEDNRQVVERLRELGVFTELQVLKGDPVIRQFGAGPVELPWDELDRRALAGEEVQQVRWEDGYRVVRYASPLPVQAECQRCHQAQIGEISGVISTEISLRDYEQVLRQRRDVLLVVVGGGLLALSLLTFYALQRLVIRPMQEIRRGAAAIAQGDLRHRLQVRTGDELEVLAGEFNRMAAQLQESYASLEQKAIENARLYQEARRRLNELSALFEVSGALRGAATVEDMLPIIMGKTIEVLGADTGALYLLDEPAGELVIRAAQGKLEAMLGRRVRLGEGISGYVAQSGETHVSPDFSTDPRVTSPEEKALLEGVHSGVCVPLKTAEEVVGAVQISTYAPRTFAEGDLKLLTAIADMAASVIHRGSLFEDLEHRVRELGALFEVGQAITATLRIEDVLDFIVGAASETLGAEASYLFLWDELEERLVMRAVQGFSPELIGQVKYRLGEGLGGWVFLEGKVANVPHLAADPRWKREPEYEAALPSGQANSALVVPLVVGQKTLGVLGVVNKVAASAFTTADESLLATLAGQMAIAIENARLYEDVRGLSIATIRSLATAIDARDPYTRGHSDQVARLSVLLGRELGWSGADLEMLEFAALLHDVGKIAIPDAILRKTEPLTPEEWNSIRLHPYHSAQIVKPVKPLQRIIPWIYHHQERWDGIGYPDGLKGEKIPLAARIIAVADAFNAMTTDRPYREAKSREEAIEELRRGAGTQFDPQIAEVFVQLLEDELDITGGGRKLSGAAEPVVI